MSTSSSSSAPESPTVVASLMFKVLVVISVVLSLASVIVVSAIKVTYSAPAVGVVILLA